MNLINLLGGPSMAVGFAAWYLVAAIVLAWVFRTVPRR